MIEDELKRVLEQNKGKNTLFIRNLLKENLQFYVLNFVYNSLYGDKFLMKGGTCLRFCFGLPRLSEDLDFDVYNFESFDHRRFLEELENYFRKYLKFQKIESKISGKNKIIYLKFPILEEIGFPIDKTKPSENVLFLRIDLAPVVGKNFKTGVSLKSTWSFSFIIKRYSIEDIFAGKLAAILSRESWEGKVREPRFKGRDYFDIFWLQEKGIRPNFDYLKEVLPLKSKDELRERLTKKLNEAKGKIDYLIQDLRPFFADQNFVENFAKNFPSLAENFLKSLRN